jgi:hypothetical protein
MQVFLRLFALLCFEKIERIFTKFIWTSSQVSCSRIFYSEYANKTGLKTPKVKASLSPFIPEFEKL